MRLRVLHLAAFGYVLLIVLVALEVPLALNLSKRVDAEIRAEAKGQAQLVAASAAGRLDQADDLARLAEQAADALGGRVVIVGADGGLLADSGGGDLAAAGSYASRPEVASALRGEVAQGTRFSASLDQELLYTAVPVLDQGQRSGVVRVTQAVDSVRSEVRRDTIALVGLGVAALVLGLIVAWLLAGFLSRPLRNLTATARRIEAGDLDARASEAGAREHREVAHAFNDMTERLGRSLVAQREFVANAAHQLRTPLTGLRLRLESASLKAGDDPALRRDIDAGEREAERLAQTVTDLLTLAREGQDPAAVAPLAVGEAVRAAHERWVAVAQERGCELELHAGAGDEAVRATAEDLAVILDNLIENAIEHTDAGTTVVIEVTADERSVRLEVCDEGPGLAPGEAEQAFERFFRGRSSAQRPSGSGLGLPIVRALARRWGGDASLANRSPRGARAEVWLPRARVAAVQRSGEAAVVGEAP